MDYDFSLHILVVLVVTIPTSPRLSKTEFVDESYCISILEFLLERLKKKKRKKRKPAWPGPRPAQGRTARVVPRPSPSPGRAVAGHQAGGLGCHPGLHVAGPAHGRC